MNMITICLMLLILGLICLVAETFIPGFGVFGISGIALMVAAAVLAVMYVPFGWFFVLAEGALLALLLFLMFRHIKKRQLQGKLIMNETLNEDTPQMGDLNFFLGKEGVAKTSLRPFGDVDFNGVNAEVSTSGEYVDKGSRVKVVEIQHNKIIVTEHNQ
jgi:membrane-bound serine protease (ClpP class)